MTEPELAHESVKTRGLRFEVAMAGQGDKLALLLHGFPESAYSWRYQIPLLAAAGYRVWAPDLRGYGKSDKPRGVAEYTLDKLAQDVADLIDASGCKSVLLCGHDWGAMIAWHFAMYGIRPLERLVIMNVPHPACFYQGVRTWRQLRKSWYVGFFQLPRLPERLLARSNYEAIARSFRGMAVDKSRFPDAVLDVYRKSAAEPGALTAMVNYYRAGPRNARIHRERGFPLIEVPTLLVWGEQDKALGKELTYGTGRYVSDLTVRYLPGVSHWVQQEAPETVNAMLQAWVHGKPVPDASPAT
ncbi:MAG: alpha/beta fold hydrolase [Polyangiales bacterium]